VFTTHDGYHADDPCVHNTSSGLHTVSAEPRLARDLQQAVSLQVLLRSRLSALIAIGFPRGERKPAGIGRFRAKTNGTESSNPLRSASRLCGFSALNLKGGP
jgi:hypothetical protein